MQEKLKQLELLVTQLLARQQETEGRNAALNARVRQLEDAVTKLKGTEGEARELRDWKKNAQTVLKRLSVKIDKELSKAKEEENEIV